jgi:hypothetical protein
MLSSEMWCRCCLVEAMHAKMPTASPRSKNLISSLVAEGQACLSAANKEFTGSLAELM